MDNSLYDGYRNPSGGGFNKLGRDANLGGVLVCG